MDPDTEAPNTEAPNTEAPNTEASNTEAPDPEPPSVPAPKGHRIAVAVVSALLALCAVQIMIALEPLNGMHALAYLLAAVVLPLIVVLGFPRVFRSGRLWRRLVVSGRDLVVRAEGLDLIEVVPGPLLTTAIVRGQCEGRLVRIYRDRFEVDVESPRQGRLDAVALRGLAAATQGQAKARAAASLLAAQGVVKLEILSDKVIVHGSSACAALLIPAAVEIALAPARIRFSATSAKGEQGCPYCHQPIASVLEAPSVRCPGCDAVHHTECWQEHGGCSVFRCRRAPPQRASEPPAAPAPVDPDEPLEIHVRKHA